MAIHSRYRGRTCAIAIAGVVGWAWFGLAPAHGGVLTPAILVPTSPGETTVDNVTDTILGAAPFQQFYIGVKDDDTLTTPTCIRLLSATNLPGMAPNMDNPPGLPTDSDVLEATGGCLSLTAFTLDGVPGLGALVTPTDGGLMAQVELTTAGGTITTDLFADSDNDNITDNYEILYTGSPTGIDPLEDLDASLEPGTPAGDLWPGIDEARGVCVSPTDTTEGFTLPGNVAGINLPVCKHIRTDARRNPNTGDPPRDLYLSTRLGETCDGLGTVVASQVSGFLPQVLETLQTADVMPHLLADGQMRDRALNCQLAGSSATIAFLDNQVPPDRDMGFNSASPARRPAMRIWEIIEDPNGPPPVTPVASNGFGPLQTGADNVFFFFTRYQIFRDAHLSGARLGTYVPGKKAGTMKRTRPSAANQADIDLAAIPWYLVHEILHGLEGKVPYSNTVGYHCGEDSGCMLSVWLYLKGNDWYIPDKVRSIEVPDERFQ